jgi:hypothetical protein
MEIRFDRLTHYTLDLKPKDLADLADNLGLTKAQVKSMNRSGDLMDDYRDTILNWVLDNEGKAQATSHEDIEDLEID